MTLKEALETFSRGEKLDQDIIRRLLSAGLITSVDVTNMETPIGQQEFLPVKVTLKGQRLLDKANSSKKRKRKKKRFSGVRNWLTKVKIGATVGVILSITGLCLTYKYNGADDLRNKVYSPLNAELVKIEGSLNANSVTQPFISSSLNSLKQSGDFYRLPKSLQREISAFYGEAGQLQSNVAALSEMLERQMSARIEKIRTEALDRDWFLSASSRIRAQALSKPGKSDIIMSQFSHSFYDRVIDQRDPNNLIVTAPGGPIWEINDWLTYPDSIEKVSAIWTEDDFLYFGKHDPWYYRITRNDLQRLHTALKDFLDPVHQMLLKNDNFEAIEHREPELLRRLVRLKAIMQERMDSPKRLSDLFD